MAPRRTVLFCRKKARKRSKKGRGSGGEGVEGRGALRRGGGGECGVEGWGEVREFREGKLPGNEESRRGGSWEFGPARSIAPRCRRS